MPTWCNLFVCEYNFYLKFTWKTFLFFKSYNKIVCSFKQKTKGIFCRNSLIKKNPWVLTLLVLQIHSITKVGKIKAAPSGADVVECRCGKIIAGSEATQPYQQPEVATIPIHCFSHGLQEYPLVQVWMWSVI